MWQTRASKITVIEARFGLFAEVSFIATFTQRHFGKQAKWGIAFKGR